MKLGQERKTIQSGNERMKRGRSGKRGRPAAERRGERASRDTINGKDALLNTAEIFIPRIVLRRVILAYNPI